MKRKQPYWSRLTAAEWEALTPEAQTEIWSKRPTRTPTLEERLADLERRVGILERDDQG